MQSGFPEFLSLHTDFSRWKPTISTNYSLFGELLFSRKPKSASPERGTAIGGGGVLVESFAWCAGFHGSTPQSSLRLASSPIGEPIIHKGEPEQASPLGEGNQRSWWRGSCGIFCLMCKFSRKYTPQSSLRLASSAQGTPYGCPKGEPIVKGSLILYITPKTDNFSPQCGLRFALQKDRGISWRFPVIFS